jgi:polyhydroxybutyrate depolymerase
MILAATLSLTLHLLSGGLDRTYHLYRPASLAPAASAPLVVMLHGGYGSGTQAERAYGWDREADAHGFIVAYPDGIGRSWNAGMCCGSARTRNIDDVGFVTAMVRAVEADYHADPRRIYVTGMSNGAMMTYRIACEAPFAIAAIGPVAGTLDMPACVGAQRLPVMEIHGLQDRHVPFSGGVGINHPQPQPFPSVPSTLAVWQRADGCAGTPARETRGVVTTTLWPCRNGTRVELVTIANAGHEWPGSVKGARGAILGRLLHIAPADPVSDAFDATDLLWDFFRSAPAPIESARRV